jgi:hypothetical protein
MLCRDNDIEKTAPFSSRKGLTEEGGDDKDSGATEKRPVLPVPGKYSLQSRLSASPLCFQNIFYRDYQHRSTRIAV